MGWRYSRTFLAVAAVVCLTALARTASSPSSYLGATHRLPGHTIVLVVGKPFSGTSALEGLLANSPKVSTLCSSGTWQCEDTKILVSLGIINNRTVTGADQQKFNLVAMQDWISAFHNFTEYWDLSKPLLLDKSPGNAFRVDNITKAVRAVGCKAVFVVLTRSPYTLSASAEHPFLEDGYVSYARAMRDALRNPDVDTVQVMYEDLVQGRNSKSLRNLEARLPELAPLNLHASALPKTNQLQDVGVAERTLPIAEYFELHPLKHTYRALQPQTKALMCDLGYELMNDDCERYTEENNDVIKEKEEAPEPHMRE